jgi:hypothetical protein
MNGVQTAQQLREKGNALYKSGKLTEGWSYFFFLFFFIDLILVWWAGFAVWLYTSLLQMSTPPFLTSIACLDVSRLTLVLILLKLLQL